MAEATNTKTPGLGQQTADGVYAGLTADGKQQIYAMPQDLSVIVTFNDAVRRVERLNANNALGHNDWQIPSLENLRVLEKNQNEGNLKGTFKTVSSGVAYPDWYWSSSQNGYCSDWPWPGSTNHYSTIVNTVRLSNGDEDWARKDSLCMSCRPVRLVAAPL